MTATEPLDNPTQETRVSENNLKTADGIEIDPEEFASFVEEYPRGQLGLELSEALTRCVAASRLYGKKSTVTLTINMRPGEGYEETVDVQADVAAKPARPTPPTVTFFPTASKGLSRRDPNQPQIPGTEDQ